VHRLLWIVPETNAFHRVVRLFGYLQPVLI
jgi:hypothetical protein